MKIEKQKEIEIWQLDNTRTTTSGCVRDIPTNSKENIALIVERHNALVLAFNQLLEKVGNK